MNKIENFSEYSIVEEKDEDALNPPELTHNSKVDSTPAFSMIVNIEPDDFAFQCPI